MVQLCLAYFIVVNSVLTRRLCFTQPVSAGEATGTMHEEVEPALADLILDSVLELDMEPPAASEEGLPKFSMSQDATLANPFFFAICVVRVH